MSRASLGQQIKARILPSIAGLVVGHAARTCKACVLSEHIRPGFESGDWEVNMMHHGGNVPY